MIVVIVKRFLLDKRQSHDKLEQQSCVYVVLAQVLQEVGVFKVVSEVDVLSYPETSTVNIELIG